MQIYADLKKQEFKSLKSNLNFIKIDIIIIGKRGYSMNIVIAPDSYKGSLTSLEVGNAISDVFKEVIPEANLKVIPIADGGEGTLEALLFATGGQQIPIEVIGPLGDRILTEYGILGDNKTVVIEIAKIAGLTMIPKELQNPIKSTTYGVGEVILDACNRGYRDFIIGLGGSATNDGGLGMLQALDVTFLNEQGDQIVPIAANLAKVKKVDFSTIDPLLMECRFQVACDVVNPLCGEQGASAVYGPQKGATAAIIKQLDEGLANYACMIEDALHKKLQNIPGAGAAGGLGFAFLTINGELTSGSKLISEACDLENAIRSANLVITGEGQSDHQTLFGKAPMFIANTAKNYEVPVILLSGSLGNGFEKLTDVFTACFSITNRPMTLENSIEAADDLLRHQARNIANLVNLNFRKNE